jgi:hypothetical protein
MITVDHSACLLLGGSFEPTYILTINALPVQLQPTTNKRNAALIQAFMTESIGVSPERGILKFVPIAEESLAMNGMTILGDIERMERQHGEETGSNIKRAMTKSSRKAKSMQLSRGPSKANAPAKSGRESAVPHDGPLDSGVAVNEKGINDTVTRKKSEQLLSKFGRKSSNAHMVPPPIPVDRPTPAIKKHKSFMNVFRKSTS